MGSKGGVSVKGKSLPCQLLSLGSLVVLLQTKCIAGGREGGREGGRKEGREGRREGGRKERRCGSRQGHRKE